MDHDDYSYPTRIQKQLEYMQANNLDVCGTNYEILHERNGYIEKVNRSFKNWEIKEKLLFLPWIILNPTVCIKGNIFNQFGYFNDDYDVTFDYEYYVRIMDNITFGIVPVCLYRWHQHKNSYSSKTAVEGRQAFRQIALNKIEGKKSMMPRYKYFQTVGLLNYYSDNMSKAIVFLAFSLARHLEKRTLKYFFSITLFGFIIKIVRKYSLFGLPIVRHAKKFFVVQ